MELLKANRLNLNNGSKDILTDADFRILEGQKCGLIGPNGAGKTTLIRLILGEIEPDSGTLHKKKDLNIGYLPQQPDYDREQSIESFLLTELSPILSKLNKLEELMATPDCINMEKTLQEYQTQCDLFESGGGYSALDRGEVLLKKLGLDNSLKQTMGTLSGGERSLTFFAKALLSNPELLILDEPGNHLDYLGLAWLESFISSYTGAVLIVSHNRYLLDKTCTHLFDMFNGEMINFKGNYSDLKVSKLRDALTLKSEYESSKKKSDQLEKKIKQLQSIAMSQYNPPATVMAQLSDAKTKLAKERDKELEKPVIENEALKLKFESDDSKSKIAMQVKEFNYSFEDKTLFNNAELEIMSGEKVALVGQNGSGKTTFITNILKNGDWDNKNLRIGPSMVVGYLSQVPRFTDKSYTIEEEIRSWGALTSDGAFGIAKNFSFTYKDMTKSLSVLSGGEVNRLQLARLMYNKTNFLILDEPTNHMDIQSREVIEEALIKFSGTLLVISHDRFFLDQLVNRVIEIDNRQFYSFKGNFSKYFKVKYPILPRLSGKVSKRGAERKNKTNMAPSNIQLLEERIQTTENEKLVLERELKRCFDNSELQKGRKVSSKLDKLKSKLNKLYAEWEDSVISV